MGFGIDLRASFPAIVTGLVAELVRERSARADMTETCRMIRDLKDWRRKAAQELDVSVQVAKRGVSAMLFGMRHEKWKQRQGISNAKRSLSMEKIEREVIRARGLIVDHEIKKGTASRKEKETGVLSRSVERVEREIVDTLEAHLTRKGWTISTLIHDEIIIQRPRNDKCQSDSVEALVRESKLVLRSFEEARGWAPGTLDAKLCTY